MARLNEPPVVPAPAVETVELVKRRYLRQNRELAKTNSLQSIRIRNLETEGSRLLAENLSLREQVLQLQNNIDAQPSCPSFESIDAVKSRLEAKLAEFGSLVAELSQIPKPDGVARRAQQKTAARPSAEDRQWRGGLGLQAVEDAMLPTIVEDKYYPRRTMGADELRDILEETDSQSPDVGPPPVSRFDDEEPIAFGASKPSAGQAPEAMEEASAPLPPNLETRKRRRESGPRLDMRRVSMFEPPAEEVQPELETKPTRNIRTGAKRKFSVQEDENNGARGDANSEPFNFPRKSSVPGTISEQTTEEQQQAMIRPILSSKPVNTDPVVSPKKQRSSASGKLEKKLSEKRTTTTSRSARARLTITRTVQPELQPMQLPVPTPVEEIVLEPLPPKTPAVETIISPPSTEPSTSRPETRDTPPPGDLTSGDQNTLGVRPSRRARPQVSYKEPSLNTKMRRPGKELIDAVVPSNDRRSSVEPKSVAKKESEDAQSAWRSLASDQGRGDEQPETGSPLREKLGRNLGDGQEATRLNSAAASEAISALISATSTSKKRALQPTTTQLDSSADTSNPPPVAKEPEKDNLAIFDFTDSSPHETGSSRPRIDLAKRVKSARRHSAMATSSSSDEKSALSKSKPDGNLPLLQSRTDSGSGAKSSGTLSLHSRSGSTSKASVRERRTGIPALPGKNADAQPSEAAIITTDLKTERAISRRRSMMI